MDSYTIRGIKLVDKADETCEPIAEILKGGIGQKFARVKVTSGSGCGLHSTVSFLADRPNQSTGNLIWASLRWINVNTRHCCYLLLQKLQTNNKTYHISLNWFELVAFILSVNWYKSFRRNTIKANWMIRCFVEMRDAKYLRVHSQYPLLLSNGSSWIQYLIFWTLEGNKTFWISVHRFFQVEKLKWLHLLPHFCYLLEFCVDFKTPLPMAIVTWPCGVIYPFRYPQWFTLKSQTKLR